MMREVWPYGKRARLLVTVLWKESRTGSLREPTRLAKAPTMSVYGREDEKLTLHFLSKFSLKLDSMVRVEL